MEEVVEGVVEDLSPKPILVSVEIALAFIENKSDNTAWTEPEKYVLGQLRRWGTVCDVDRIIDALQRKKQALLSSSADANPTATE